MSRTSPRGTSKRTVAGVRSRACPSWKGGVGLSPPHAVGRSACSPSEHAGWGHTSSEKSWEKGVGVGREAYLASRRSGKLSRLPATRGGRPARAASSPGGESQPSKRLGRGEWGRVRRQDWLALWCRELRAN